MRRLTSIAMVAALALAEAGCDQSGPRVVPGGDAREGGRLIVAVGCGGCHAIPGIRNARGVIGPPLGNIADRMIIAGVLANTPENMIAWLQSPQSIVPGNAMPNSGLSHSEARDVAAYLYTLR
jgi:cytochrome c2